MSHEHKNVNKDLVFTILITILLVSKSPGYYTIVSHNDIIEKKN